MEQGSEIATAGRGTGSSKKLKLNKSFKLALRSLLTSPSRQGFTEAFPNFTTAEQERLHQLFIQIITSLHGNIEDDVESFCDETQVGIILDTIEQAVEEQSLDSLFPNKMNSEDVGRSLSVAKKNEIQYLTNLLKKAGEQKRITGDRIELLKRKKQDSSGSVYAVEKLKSRILNFEALNSTALQ